MTPKQFGNKDEHWREWCEEVRDYMDVVKPGMKEILIAAEKETDNVVDVNWARSKTEDLGMSPCRSGEHSQSSLRITQRPDK